MRQRRLLRREPMSDSGLPMQATQGNRGEIIVEDHTCRLKHGEEALIDAIRARRSKPFATTSLEEIDWMPQ